MSKRIRRVGSIKSELLKKSREAALAAVQIFNNPNISFKSESYVVLMIIAWTYLLHAYFRNQRIEYRYFRQNGEVVPKSRTKVSSRSVKVKGGFVKMSCFPKVCLVRRPIASQ